jgi:hypothetical protein
MQHRVKWGMLAGLAVAGCWIGLSYRVSTDSGGEMMEGKELPVAVASVEVGSAFVERVRLLESEADRLQYARDRAAHMLALMQREPRRAVEVSLSLSEWLALPDPVRALVEEPFSTVAEVEVLIACGAHVSEIRVEVITPEHGRLQAQLYGDRTGGHSKKAALVQGIRVGQMSVLRNMTFQRLDASDEVAALLIYPVAVAKSGENAVAALAGGRLFYFEDEAAWRRANEAMAALEALPGPGLDTAELLDALIAEKGFDFEAAHRRAREVSMQWTGTPRDMLVILVDFPDRPGTPTDAASLEETLNTTVSMQIWEMSQEKTYIVGRVHPTVYRMSLNNSAYSDSYLLYNEATGAASADGISMADYETICIFHPPIDGVSYAGLALIGGKKMWLRSASPDVIIHELGHNYGAYHASSWTIASGNPVDPAGAGSEYGDFLDIMGGGDSPEGHFNCWHKRRINWLDAGDWLPVTTSGTYRVYQGDHRQTTDGLVQGLEIPKGTNDFYWVGHRQLYNQTYDCYGRGLYLLWKRYVDEKGWADHRSYLIDTTPGSDGGKYDGGLVLGQTYSDAEAQLHITPVGRGGVAPDVWMDVRVNMGAFSGNQPPVATLQGPTSAHIQQSVLFSVEASDPDGDELAYHWDFGDGLVKANAPSVPGAWLSGTTGRVSCVVSDMKGGTVRVSRDVPLSSELDNWTARSSGITQDLRDVAVGNGRIVAVADKGITCYSADGTVWSSHDDVDVWAGNLRWEGLIYDGEQFVTVGYDYDHGTASWVGSICVSPDGLTWSERYSGQWDGIPKLRDVAYGNGVYVAVGNNGTILRSTDTHVWTKQISGVTTNDLSGVSYGDGRFVVVGSAPNSWYSRVLSSSNGIDWVDLTASIGLEHWRGMHDVQFCNDRFLAGGWNMGIRYSTDGGLTFPDALTSYHSMPAFAYGNGLYLAAGKVQRGAAVNFISLDGMSWSKQQVAAQDDRNAAAFFNGTFVTVGAGGSIWQSGPIGDSHNGGFAIWQRIEAARLGMDRDPLDDADRDGVNNLYEYALGSSASDPASVPSVSWDASGPYFEARFARDSRKNDLLYTGQRSVNLRSNDWSAAYVSTVEDVETNLTLRSALPLQTQSNEFLRLKIELK